MTVDYDFSAIERYNEKFASKYCRKGEEEVRKEAARLNRLNVRVIKYIKMSLIVLGPLLITVYEKDGRFFTSYVYYGPTGIPENPTIYEAESEKEALEQGDEIYNSFIKFNEAAIESCGVRLMKIGLTSDEEEDKWRL